jgi:hypothetical protein
MDLLSTYTHHSDLRLITALHAKSSPAYNVFNSRFLVTDSNSGDSSPSRPQLLASRFQYRTACQLSTELVARVLFFITPRHGPRRQHLVSRVACVAVAAGPCLPSRCIATAVASLFVSRYLPSKSSIRHCTKCI